MSCADNFNPVQIYGSAVAPQQHFHYIGGDVSSITFNGTLSPNNINPDILSSPGGGTFTATINETSFSWDITYTGLYQNFSGPTNFYLQGPATPETNGNIIYDLKNLGSFIPNTLEGETLVTPTIIKIIKSGESYINIQTVRYPNGEVRGNLELANSTFGGPVLSGSAVVFGPLVYTSSEEVAITLSGTFDGTAIYNNYIVNNIQPQNLNNSLIFTGTINASQNIPVSSSVRTGLLFCHYDKQSKKLSFSFTYSGFASELTNCRLRGPATTITNGPIILEIPITGSAIRGTLNLNQEQEKWLIAGLLYVEIIDTGALSIRGNLGTPLSNSNIEITQNYTIFYANLNGNNMVPPTASTSTGDGLFYLDIIDKKLYWLVNLYNITGITQLTLIGPANSSQTGVQQINIGALTAGSNNPIMAFTSITDNQVQQLLENSWYIQINTFTYLTGDIRGQLTSIPITKALVEFSLSYEPPGEITTSGSAVVNFALPYNIIPNPLSPRILPESYINLIAHYNYVVPTIKFTTGFVFIECDGADYLSSAFNYTVDDSVPITLSYETILYWFLADGYIQIGNPDDPTMEAIVTINIPYESLGDTISMGSSATMQYFYEATGDVILSEPSLTTIVMFNSGGSIILDDEVDLFVIYNNYNGNGEIVLSGSIPIHLSIEVSGEIILSGETTINISPNVSGGIIIDDGALLSVFYNFIPTLGNIVLDGTSYFDLYYISVGEIILNNSAETIANYIYDPILGNSIIIYDASLSYEGTGNVVVNGESFLDILPDIGGSIILDGEVNLVSDVWSYETSGDITLDGGEDYFYIRNFVYDSEGTIIMNSFANVVSVGNIFTSGWGRYLRARTSEELIREGLLVPVATNRGKYKEATAYCIPVNNQKLGICEIKSDRKIINGAYVAKVTAKRQQPFMPCKKVPNENKRSCD